MVGIIVLIIYILGIILTVFGLRKITTESCKKDSNNKDDLFILIFGLILWPSTLCGLLIYTILKKVCKIL